MVPLGIHLEGEPNSADGTTTLSIKANAEEAALIRFANFLMFRRPNDAVRAVETSQSFDTLGMTLTGDTLTLSGPTDHFFELFRDVITLPPPPSELPPQLTPRTRDRSLKRSRC